MLRTMAASAATVAVGGVLAWAFEAKQVGDVLLLASMAASWTFTVLYASRSGWRLLNAGRSLLYVMFSLSVVLTQNALSIYFPSYFGRGVFRVEMYLCLFVAIVSMAYVLWRIQQSDKHTRVPDRFKGE